MRTSGRPSEGGPRGPRSTPGQLQPELTEQQLSLFDLVAIANGTPHALAKSRGLDGVERLLREMVRRGLQPEHALPAAALVLELDRAATNGGSP